MNGRMDASTEPRELAWLLIRDRVRNGISSSPGEVLAELRDRQEAWSDRWRQPARELIDYAAIRRRRARSPAELEEAEQVMLVSVHLFTYLRIHSRPAGR
jgi:hypothetical protein